MDPKLAKILGAKTEPDAFEKALFEKTQKYARFVSWIPWLRMIAICNSLSMYASDKDSDIDLFIVSEPRRMWLARVLMSVVFHVLGVRRHGKRVSGRFCLSFFATTEGLDFEKLAIENDIYLRTWASSLKPILDIGNCYEEFVEKNRKFTEITNTQKKTNLQFLSNARVKKSEHLPFVWNVLDNFCRAVFLPRTLREYERLGKPWGIIISQNLLKFHRNDARKELRDRMV